jgi:hypothetical protein
LKNGLYGTPPSSWAHVLAYDVLERSHLHRQARCPYPFVQQIPPCVSLESFIMAAAGNVSAFKRQIITGQTLKSNNLDRKLDIGAVIL